MAIANGIMIMTKRKSNNYYLYVYVICRSRFGDIH